MDNNIPIQQQPIEQHPNPYTRLVILVLLILVILILGVSFFLKNTKNVLKVQLPQALQNVSSDNLVYRINYATGSATSKTYIADAGNKKATDLSSVFSPDSSLIPSPDGKYIAAVTDNKIVISSANNLQTSTTAYKVGSSNEHLNQYVSWSSDSSKIAFISYADLGKSLYTTSIDGSNKKLIRTFDPSVSPYIAGFDTTGNRLFITQYNEGAIQQSQNFYIVDITSGEAKPVDKLSWRAQLGGSSSRIFGFSSDFSKVYYQGSDQNISEYSFSDQGSKVLFNTKGDLLAKSAPMIAKQGLIAFSIIPDPTNNFIETYIVNTATDQVSLLESAKPGNGFAVAWSPDGKYLCFEHNFGPNIFFEQQQDYVMEVATKKTQLFDTPKTKDKSIQLFGWLD